jgi:Lrp/AsnC family transcriptional regulator, leucine-responsive regulatory protein
MNPEQNSAIDDIDRKILRALTNDGRLSFRDLSERVYLSPNATAERVRQLQSKGIIRRFHASLNPALLGLTLEAYIDVKLQTGTSAQNFETAVTKLPGVVSMAILTGSFDVRLRVACKDQADLIGLIEMLRTRAGAQETNSTLICREVEPRNWNI